VGANAKSTAGAEHNSALEIYLATKYCSTACGAVKVLCRRSSAARKICELVVEIDFLKKALKI